MFKVVISYFVREIIQAARKDQEMLVGMLRNNYLSDVEVFMCLCVHVFWNYSMNQST